MRSEKEVKEMLDDVALVAGWLYMKEAPSEIYDPPAMVCGALAWALGEENEATKEFVDSVKHHAHLTRSLIRAMPDAEQQRVIKMLKEFISQ